MTPNQTLFSIVGIVIIIIAACLIIISLTPAPKPQPAYRCDSADDEIIQTWIDNCMTSAYSEAFCTARVREIYCEKVRR